MNERGFEYERKSSTENTWRKTFALHVYRVMGRARGRSGRTSAGRRRNRDGVETVGCTACVLRHRTGGRQERPDSSWPLSPVGTVSCTACVLSHRTSEAEESKQRKQRRMRRREEEEGRRTRRREWATKMQHLGAPGSNSLSHIYLYE